MAFRPRALLLFGLLAVAACGRDKVEPTDAGTKGSSDVGGGGGAAATPGPTFVYARGKESKGLDPAEVTDGESSLVLVNVYDTLIRHKYGSSDLEPALATSWTSAPDRLSLTLVLREGVSFHDGTPMDAAAVVSNLERQRDEKHPFHFVPGRYPYWGDMFGSVKLVSAPDAKTVRIEFSEPMPPFFPSLLAMFSCSIVSPKALARGKDFVARNAVGTGAFRFVSWETEEITLERNASWWGGAPKLGKLVFVVVNDVRTAFVRLETGQVDGIDNVAGRDVERIRKDSRFRLHQLAGGHSVCYLAMNNDVKPFDDVRVRRAVAMAIDKPRLVNAAYEGLAVPISTLVPPGIPGHATIPDRPRDVAGAKALLAEAGASGAKVTLRFPSNPRPYLPDPNATAASIRDDLRDIGLDVELKKEEWSAYLPLLQNGEHQLGIIGWSPDVFDADNYLYVLLSKEGAVKGSANNYAFYRSDAFQDKVARARRSYDPAERVRLYAEAQQLCFDDAPIVPLIAMPRTAAMSAKVEGFVLDPISSPRFAWTSKP